MSAMLDHFPGGLASDDPHFEKVSKAYNKKWLRVSNEEGGLRKISALHEDQLESYLRETCIFDKVLPPTPVDPADLEVGIDNDTLFHRIYFQFETRAYLGSFEATPTEVQEIYIPRIFMTFHMLTTPTYVLNDYNLPAYPFPVGQQVEDSIGMDMQEAKDWCLLKKLEETIQASRSTHDNVLRGAEAAKDIVDNGARIENETPYRGKLDRTDFSSLKEYYADKRSKLDRVIIPEKNFIQIERWDTTDFGDNLQGEVVINGYTYDQINGVKFIRTIKTDAQRGDVFREGNIYGFATPNEVGRNRTLRGLKFHIDRDHQFLKFDAQMAFGFIWAVSAKVCKLELYNGGYKLNNTQAVAPFFVDGGGVLPTIPGSDALWGDPEFVTEKDYYNIDQEFHRPLIRYV